MTYLFLGAGIAGVIIVLLVVFFTYSFYWMSSVSKKIHEEGVDVKGWIVRVIPAEGLMWPIAVVLIANDQSVSDEAMRDMVAKVRAARKSKNKTPDESKVAKLTGKGSDNLGRPKLPKSFTDGHIIHSFFMDVGINESENLSADWEDGEFIPLRIMWEEHETVAVVPQQKQTRMKQKKK